MSPLLRVRVVSGVMASAHCSHLEELILTCGNAAISFDLQRQPEALILSPEALLEVSVKRQWVKGAVDTEPCMSIV